MDVGGNAGWERGQTISSHLSCKFYFSHTKHNSFKPAHITIILLYIVMKVIKIIVFQSENLK